MIAEANGWFGFLLAPVFGSNPNYCCYLSLASRSSAIQGRRVLAEHNGTASITQI